MSSLSQDRLLFYPPEEESGSRQTRVLLHPTERRWLLLNRTASEIAQLLLNGRSVDETAIWLARDYDLPLQDLVEDIHSIRQELLAHHFLNSSRETPQRIPKLERLLIHLTTRCNLRCSHCYLACPSEQDMTPKAIFRMVEEFKAEGGQEIILSGGEPLLHPDFLNIFESLASSLKAVVFSNGTLITGKWARLFARYPDTRIQISMDGPRAEIHDCIRGKGSFEKTVRGIRTLQEAGMGGRVSLATTLMNPNLENANEVIHFAQQLQVSALSFSPLMRTGRAEEEWGKIGIDVRSENFRRFVFELGTSIRGRTRSIEITGGLSGFILEMPPVNAPDDIWCPVGKMLTVAADGTVFPCSSLMREGFSIGNAIRESLSSLMKSDAMQKMCCALVQRRNYLSECAACPWKNFCQGGCMAQALDKNNTLWSADSFCELRKKAYEHAFERLLGQHEAALEN